MKRAPAKSPTKFILQRTVTDTNYVRVDIPIKIESIANARSWTWHKPAAKKAARRKLIGSILNGAVHRAMNVVTCQAFQVTLTRVAPRSLDDDNLAHAWKAERDGIADVLRVNDGDKTRVRFTYLETNVAPRTYGARIEIRGLSKPFEGGGNHVKRSA